MALLLGGTKARSLVKEYKAEQTELEKLQEGIQHELQELEAFQEKQVVCTLLTKLRYSV